MNIKQQYVGFYTIIIRELTRMFRIASQVFFPPIITTSLYFLIFGALMGSKIGLIDGISYTLFIAPGLIMMSVIANAYSNVSSSLFSMRFQKNIEEILISPISNGFLLLGYVLAGMIRGCIVAVLVFSVALFFVKIEVHHPALTMLVIMLVAGIFSLAGFINGMIARNFDDVMLIPTFVLTPLTYLGGVFYSTTMLAPIWQKASHLNPIFYMINALRYAMLGQKEGDLVFSILIVFFILIVLIVINLVLLKKGVGLRS